MLLSQVGGYSSGNPALGEVQQEYVFENHAYPSYCRSLRRLVLLVPDMLVRFSKSAPHSALGQCVHQKREGHHHDQRHDALFRFQIQALGVEHRILEKPEASLHGHALVLVHLQQLSIGERFGIELVGGDDEHAFATLRLLDRLLVVLERPFDLPLDHIRFRTGSRTTSARIPMARAYLPVQIMVAEL